ncbi:MAG: hypothetical protein ABI690_00690 [Chloroflexota bacterium]
MIHVKQSNSGTTFWRFAENVACFLNFEVVILILFAWIKKPDALISDSINRTNICTFTIVTAKTCPGKIRIEIIRSGMAGRQNVVNLMT